MPKDHADVLILALDVGSSSTRSAIFDSRARQLPHTDASERSSIRYTPDGGAELSPILVRRAVTRCLTSTLNKHRRAQRGAPAPITALASSSFWHGLLGLDRQWKPITPIYTWADSRAADAARRLREQLSARAVHARTGCVLHSSFWPAKLTWLRQARPDLFRRVVHWVSPLDWILHELFGTTVTSASMASGTGLYQLSRGTWDEKLCAICHVDPSQLPVVRGTVETTTASHKGHLPSRLYTAIGDGAAGNLGSGADRPNVVAINVGTSAAVRVVQLNSQNLKRPLPMGLFRYVVDEDRFVIGGAVSNAGNLRQWALRELRLEDNARTNRLIFSRQAAARDRLVVLPFWAGERAPTWPDHQLGVIDGLDQATTAPEILRALTLGVFYRLAQILELLGTTGVRPKRIIVSGGILHSIPAVRLMADALGHDVEIAQEREASLRGAAVHALRQIGIILPAPPIGVVIKHDRKLAAKHRERRARQIELENVLRERASRL